MHPKLFNHLTQVLSLQSSICHEKQVNRSQQVETKPVTLKHPLKLNFGDSPLPSEWKECITTKLISMPEVFSQHNLDLGCTGKVQRHIKLHDETPFKQRARPIHPQDIKAVRKHLQDLLEAGVIRESQSPFYSPIVVVRKKNGDVRLCIDYRKLNLQTVKDASQSRRIFLCINWF